MVNATDQLSALAVSLRELISQLTSQNNEIRSAAEQKIDLEWYARKPAELLAALAFLCCHDQAIEVN